MEHARWKHLSPVTVTVPQGSPCCVTCKVGLSVKVRGAIISWFHVVRWRIGVTMSEREGPWCCVNASLHMWRPMYTWSHGPPTQRVWRHRTLILTSCPQRKEGFITGRSSVRTTAVSEKRFYTAGSDLWQAVSHLRPGYVPHKTVMEITLSMKEPSPRDLPYQYSQS